MKTVLEIFYLRIVGKSVRYQRKRVSLSRKGSDPDQLIWSLIRQEHRDDTDEADHEHEFIVHPPAGAMSDRVRSSSAMLPTPIHWSSKRGKRRIYL